MSALDLWGNVHPPSDQQHVTGGLLGPPGEKVYVRYPHRHGHRAQENVTTSLSSGWIQSPATMPGTHGVGVEGGGLDLLSRVTVNFLIVEAGRVSGAGVRRALRRLSVYP